MKERGELAYEAFCRSRLDIEPAHLTWGSLTNDTAVEYAAIERAVRNAALEEAARIFDVECARLDEVIASNNEYLEQIGRSGEHSASNDLCNNKQRIARQSAEAIRALIEEPK